MADGALTIPITQDAADRLAEHARAVGVTPEALAGQMMQQLLDDAVARSRLDTQPADYDGPHVELEDALTAFDRELERRLANRAE